MNRTTRIDHAIGAALCAAYVALLLATASAIGLSRDEGMYVNAAQSYARWFELLGGDPSAAFERSNIDRFWRANHEHPALVKSLFALSYLVDRKLELFPQPSLAYRFPGMLSAGLLLWLIYIFGVRLYDRRAGLFAAAAYALLPRPFYHAHLCAFDVPIVLALTAVCYAYLRALALRRWAIATGVLFGFALATKHNSWILPGVLAIHFGYVLLADRIRLRSRPGAAPQVRAFPYWLLAIATIGPLLFYASWPWIWHDTLPRLNEYARFHVHHDYYNIAYFGVNYFWPPFPIGFPWMMTLYTVPITTLLLAFVGLTVEVRRGLARARAALAGDESDDPYHANALLLGALLAPLVLISLPSTPIFGGTKHWFTAYPFLALFAGLGFTRALEVYAALLPERPRLRRTIAPLAAGLLLMPAAVETAHSHPFALSHYGFAAGFVPGAADRGMNRQFWGFTTRSLVRFFEKNMPNGGSVYVCDTTDTAFRMLSRDGLLPDSITPSFDIATADFAIVHHEHHFAEVDHQIWTVYGTTRPAHVLTYDGVPIISVYENPRRKR